MRIRLVATLCGKISLPFTNSPRTLQDAIQALPRDLGPEAVGLSRDLVKQCHIEESVDVSYLIKILKSLILIFASSLQLLRKLNCCSGISDH